MNTPIQSQPPRPHRGISRRKFLERIPAMAAATIAVQIPGLLNLQKPRAEGASPADLVAETFSGLIAFVVPGPDIFSVNQGVSTSEPGGIAANVMEVLMETLDKSQAPIPGYPPFSAIVATILNDVALAINPSGN